jgi:co-chaperonin GroES (HSP10)
MNSLYDFIVKPYNEKRYDNSIKVGNKELVLNTKIEAFKAVNNIAEVIAVPLAYKTSIKVGDKVIIHHNVFRVFYDMKGRKKNSRSMFIDNMFFVALDQVYMYGDFGNWKAFGDRCFIMPLKNNDSLTLDKERKLIGILKYGNSSLNALKINPGDLVGYTPYGEFDFIIDDQRLYCMKSNDIVIKYEYQGNEVENNPSWAKSS